MIEPAATVDELRRLASLRALGLLDTPAEERFDRITRLAQRLFSVPIALVSLVDEDRQWFKSHMGLDVDETPRSSSFCAHALDGDQVVQVADARVDPRFADNPLVLGDPCIRFYAGAPISAPDGSALGTLCVIDRQARTLSDIDIRALEDLADMVEQEIATVHLALADDLTGLSNRRGFALLGQKVLDVCARQNTGAVVVYIDIDHLKPINDGLGHAAGDRAIREFADALATAFRASDVIGRLGGDEFAVLLSGAPDAEDPLGRLRGALDERNAELGAGFMLAFSCGTSVFDPASPETLEELLSRADAAMYAEKTAKRSSRPPIRPAW